MPFFLYQRHASTDGSWKFRRLRKVSIGGKHGPVAAHASGECGGVSRCGWHMSETRLLGRLGVTPEHAVLIDLKPRKKGNVSLYRLTDVWGFSYREWTPLCLRLEPLFMDKKSDDAEAFKEEFEFRAEDGGTVIHEFLYLNGGISEGTWNWGMTGTVNGALLFRDAWEYLAGQVRYE